jgi:hypothetical protein
LAHFLDFSRFSQIFPSFSKFFHFFLMQSGIFLEYNQDHVWYRVSHLSHKKNNGFFRIFFCKDSFLKIEFGHL